MDPSVGNFAWVLSLGAEAEGLCPFVREAAVEGMGPAQRGLGSIGCLYGDEGLGLEFGFVVRVG